MTPTTQPLDRLTLADYKYKRHRTHMHMARHLREHHGDLSLPVRRSISLRIEEDAKQLALETRLGPLVGAFDELRAAYEELTSTDLAHKTIDYVREAAVSFDGKDIDHVPLHFKVKIELCKVKFESPFTHLHCEAVAVKSGVSVYELEFLTWKGTLESHDFAISDPDANATTARHTPAPAHPPATPEDT